MNITLDGLLNRHRHMLIDEVVRRLGAGRSGRYRDLGDDGLRKRVERLHTEFKAGLSVGPAAFVTYVEDLATERHDEGFRLSDVQAALRIFEEQIWRLVVAYAPASEQVEALAWTTGIIGAAKDRLAQIYLESPERRRSAGSLVRNQAEECWRGTDPAPMSEADRGAAPATRV